MDIGYFGWWLLCISCIRGVELGISVKLIVEVFFRLLHYIATLYLPVVFGAVASLEGFVLSFFNSGKNIDIFVININAENKRKKDYIKIVSINTSF